MSADPGCKAAVAAAGGRRSRASVASSHLDAARGRLEGNDVGAAIEYVEQALEVSRSASVLRAAIRLFYDAAELERAARLVKEFEAAGTPGPADRKLMDRVRDRAQMLAWARQPALPRAMPAVERRVVNLLAYSLPYSSVGYATRSHGLARGVSEAGWEIRPYTRLGFPFDQMPELRGQSLPQEDVIDGITYCRLLDGARGDGDELKYCKAAITSYRRVFETVRPALVHAASNHVTGLPALVAARQSGIPCVYEVRGFWEVTRSSGDAEFASSPTFRHIRFFETLVAQAADHVITLTEGMRRDLMARGVPATCISIVPNAVDVERFAPRERDAALAMRLQLPADVPVIGYVGSFVEYEGLDDLVAAAAILAARGHQFRLLLVGDGLALPRVCAAIDAAGLADRAVIPGRVPHDQVSRYYSLIDVCPFPRKPWEVCQLVSPLKPFEAMAQSKPVVAANTAALREIVTHEQTGLLFKSGDPIALASALATLLSDRYLREQLGVAAREWVLRNRTWRAAGTACVAAYRRAMREQET